MLQHVILSRTDNLGDVLFTLPMARFLKKTWPGVKVSFIGKRYTQPIIGSCRYIDAFLDREILLSAGEMPRADAICMVFPDRAVAALAKKQDISVRVGTSHRLFHWWYCNRLVNFSRIRSGLHEAQLNFRLFRPLGLEATPSLQELGSWYGLEPNLSLPPLWEELAAAPRFCLIIHPKSKGSAREWPMAHYHRLVQQLPTGQYWVLVSGTADEGARIKAECPEIFQHPHVRDLTGALSLEAFMTVIAHADGLLACSTGPLHIAAALGRHCLGLYPSRKPMHPGRWGPLGPRASYLETDQVPGLAKGSDRVDAIPVEQVLAQISTWHKLSPHRLP
jgi:ADP-heptose:LPS heptosyltransferase